MTNNGRLYRTPVDDAIDEIHDELVCGLIAMSLQEGDVLTMRHMLRYLPDGRADDVTMATVGAFIRRWCPINSGTDARAAAIHELGVLVEIRDRLRGDLT